MDDYYLIVADIVTGFITCVTFVLCLINLYLIRKLEKHNKALAVYVILCFLFDFTNTVLIHFNYSNVGLLPFFNVVELILLGVFLYKMNPYPKMTKIAIGVGVLINIYEWVHYFNTNDYIINKGRVFNAIFFLTILLSILSKDGEESKGVRTLPLIHVMIIYFTICFIQFVLLDFLVNIPHGSIFITWMLYALAGGVLYTMSTYYLWKNMKTLNM